MTFQEARSAADRATLAQLPRVAQRQEIYMSINGRYFQGHWTHSAPVSGLTAQDNLTNGPTDQEETWAEFFDTDELELPVRMRLNVYQGDDWGWELTSEFLHDGKLYRRIDQCGPERYRIHGWEQVN